MDEDVIVSPVAPGEVLAGKYRVERVLGQGGMGVVVAARHVHLDQRVALKFLRPEAAGEPEVVARFAREARAAARIRSEHVARVLDVGTLASGSPYIVMEYLEGRDLAQLLEAGGPLGVEQAVDWVLEACEALAEAHVAGIVHRDLKPANLFLAQRADRRPSVKVLDFGVSKLLTPAAGDAALTRTRAIVGSPFYMAPEQLTRGKDVDARIDVWALGVILHEALTGSTPFAAETMPEIVGRILSTEPPPLGDVRPDVPAGLAAAVARCLAKAPAERTPNVAVFARAIAPYGSRAAAASLERIARIVEGSKPPPGLPPSVDDEVTLPMVGARTDTTWDRTGHSLRVRRRSLLPFATAVAFALTGMLGTFAFLARRADVPPARGMVVPPQAASPTDARAALAVAPSVAGSSASPSSSARAASPSSSARAASPAPSTPLVPLGRSASPPVRAPAPAPSAWAGVRAPARAAKAPPTKPAPPAGDEMDLQ